MKFPAPRWLGALFFSFALTTTASAKELFDNFTVFGDSLSDMGNGSGAPITIPGGQVWSYYLAQKFGIHLSPSSQGGSDWAIAGDQTGDGPGGLSDGGVVAQVNNYLASGRPISPHGLYSVWAGANDIEDQLGEGISPVVTATNGVNNLISVINQLHAAGARFIIVFNVPYLGDTPSGQNPPPPLTPGDLNGITAYFNQRLTEQVSGLGYDVIQVDVASLLKAIYEDALYNGGRKYGFTNVTDEYKNCTSGCNPDQYLFWDGKHPTIAGHEAIADVVYQEIMAPLYTGILAVAPISVLDGQTSGVENQIWMLRTRLLTLPTGDYTVFANANYTPTDVSANGTYSPGYTADSGSFDVGLMRRLNPNWVTGLALGYSNGSYDYSSSAGSFNIDQTTGMAFAGYQYNHFYADGIASAAWNNYNNIDRSVSVHHWNGIAAGNTDGYQLGGDVITGYNLIDGAQLQSGPIAELDYQYVHVNAYTEHGADPINIQYFDQDNQSFVTSAGWQASYKLQKDTITWMPFGKLTYNYQWINGDRDVEAGVVTLPGSHYSMPFSTPDSGYMMAEAGVSALIRKDINLSLNYSTTFLQQDSHTQNVGVNVQVNL